MINNAGYGLFGSVEETREKDGRSQMETYFFGLLWLIQAVLPIMRAYFSRLFKETGMSPNQYKKGLMN